MNKILTTMLMLLFLSLTAHAQDDEEATRCDFCNMFWDRSSTRVEMELDVDGEVSTYFFESVGCVFNKIDELMEAGAEEVKVTSAEILDYSSFGSDREVVLNAHEAWYLVGTSRLKGSMAPFIAAFGSKEVAIEMQEELGGELMDHDAMAAYMRADKTESHDMHEAAEKMADAAVYVCPCEGDCCTDIMSDKPGECERCGMTLVRKGDA